MKRVHVAALTGGLVAGAVVAATVLTVTACTEAGPAAVTAPTTAVPVTSTIPPDTSAPAAVPAPAPGATATTPVVTTTTSDPWTVKTPREACLGRAVFGDPAESPYLLPFPVGEGYAILQSYCTDDGSHESQLAYDFVMPIGSEVAAARAGVVRDLREDIADDAQTSLLNYVFIEHEDGTSAFYAHLTTRGALVEIGEEVAAGQVIALSGASGRTHAAGVLHFGVFRTWPPRDEVDLAVNFSNAEGPLDARGGLREGSFYRARRLGAGGG